MDQKKSSRAASKIQKSSSSEYIHTRIKLIAFELAAKSSRRRGNPVQPRLCNAKNAIFKRLKTGFSLRSRSSPANSNAISFTHIHYMHRRSRSLSSEYIHIRIHPYIHAPKIRRRSSSEYIHIHTHIHTCIEDPKKHVK